MELVHVCSVLKLAETMLRVEENEVVRDDLAFCALSPILARAMDGARAGLRARALRSRAECHVSLVSLAGEALQMEIVEMTELAERIYRKIEDECGARDCAFLLAGVFYWRQEISERNNATKRFVESKLLLQKCAGKNVKTKLKCSQMMD